MKLCSRSPILAQKLREVGLSGVCRVPAVGPGGAFTMPALRYHYMRRLPVDVKPNSRAAFVPAFA